MSEKNMYEQANEQYGAYDINTEKALEAVSRIPISVHCWQGDDVGGFEKAGASLEGGGIQVTGSFPGKARSILELRQDIEKLMTLTPGTNRLSLHAMYADFADGKVVDRDSLEPAHFESWLQWSKEQKMNLDFNSTFFSHPKAESFTLCSKDKEIREFWIEHAKRCRDISAYFGKSQGNACIHNVWIADGMKDVPANRKFYREILAESLDDIFAKEIPTDYVKDSVESKLFGIGTEAFVAGSNEFYLGYAASRKKLLTIDMGHFHPTENVADKISSTMLFVDEVLLHLSRPLHWDSDHVVIFNDDLRLMCEEIIKSDKMEKIHVGLDFFDGSINRIGAWSLGCRSAQKALLAALLQPVKQLVQYEDEGNYFARLALFEEAKTMPLGAVWDEYCRRENVPTDRELIGAVMDYEKSIISKRN